MSVFSGGIEINSEKRNEVIDITDKVNAEVSRSGLQNGICVVHALHATAGITINENADPNIGLDFQKALTQMVPDQNDWLHDHVDSNAAAHIKASIVGPSVSLPLKDGKLQLGTWQDIFFCEFDGPRRSRHIQIQVLGE